MGSGRALALTAVVLAAAPARALLPPPPRSEEIRKSNESLVWDALKDCSAEATRRREYKIFEVEFPYSLRKWFFPRIKSGRDLDRKQYWCVEKALHEFKLEPVPEGFYSHDEVREYAIGEVQPLFPAALLPAWQHAGNDPDRVRRELGPMLPPEVTVARGGCLRLRGSPLLAPALDEWLRRIAGPPIFDGGSGFAQVERDHSLSENWWLRHRVSFDENGHRVANDTVCLEKLDSAASALRRHRPQLFRTVWFNVFQAEWVVDSRGAIVGEIGFCLQHQPDSSDDPKTPEALEALHRKLDSVLSGISYGPAPGLRRIVLGWGPNDRLTTVVGPAREPLTRSSSGLEAACDQQRSLTCARFGGEPEMRSREALRRCIQASGLDEAMLDVTFDVSPQGVVENVVPLKWMDGSPVTGQAQACLAAVFRLIRFPPSDGGPCKVRYRVESSPDP
jgi:hypothetical protein